METVISCQKIKEKDGKAIYAVGLSDGRGGESFAVEIPIGTSVNDLNIEETQWGTRIKLKKSGGSWSGGGGKRDRGGNESFALAYAKDLVVGGKVDLKNILPLADKFYVWLESKKPLAPAAPPIQKTTTQTAQAHASHSNGNYSAPAQTSDDLPF